MLRIEQREGAHVFRHEAMATELSLCLGGVERDYASQAAEAFFQRVDEIERKLSLYQENSDVTRLNRLATGETARISAECVACLEQGLQASVLTEGRFHVFVGREALRAKGSIPPFLRELVAMEPGEESADESEREQPVISLDRERRLVRKESGFALLDFGGIGKGFALDEAMEEMEDWDVPVAMANFGGSTLLFRALAEEDPWAGHLGERPLRPFRAGALASSGLSFQEAHIIDPGGGSGGPQWERSFSRAGRAALADALSTAAILMEPKAMSRVMESESEVRLAAFRGGGYWGAERFCAWGDGDE